MKKYLVFLLLLLLAGCVKQRQLAGHVSYAVFTPEDRIFIDIWFKGNLYRLQRVQNGSAILIIYNGTATYSVDPVRNIYREVNYTFNLTQLKELLKKSLNITKQDVEKEYNMKFNELKRGNFTIYYAKENSTYVEVWTLNNRLYRETVISPEQNFTSIYYRLEFLENVPQDLFKVG